MSRQKIHQHCFYKFNMSNFQCSHSKDGHNAAYIKPISVDNTKSPISAKIEIDTKLKNGSIKRKPVKVTSGADLMEMKYSGGRDLYDGYIIEDIYCEKGNEYISFTSKPDTLKLGQVIGEMNPDEYKRLQIRKTVEEHLEKELRLNPHGIKVLSLFFIDRVANYRWYDDEVQAQKGKFALMFEEEFSTLIRKPKYSCLIEGHTINTYPAEVHNGYFAQDKKKDASGNEKFKESKLSKDGSAASSEADGSVYSLIMKDKEKLLSFTSKLKFIFSHSALKEGWDNPNVFQICTLNEAGYGNKDS